MPKRALEVTAAEVAADDLASWVVDQGQGRRAQEDAWAAELGLAPGELVVDFPVKRAMFQIDVLVRRRSGVVERLGGRGIPGLIDLPRLAGELYSTARVLRVFTFSRVDIDRARALDRLTTEVAMEAPVKRT